MFLSEKIEHKKNKIADTRRRDSPVFGFSTMASEAPASEVQTSNTKNSPICIPSAMRTVDDVEMELIAEAHSGSGESSAEGLMMGCEDEFTEFVGTFNSECDSLGVGEELEVAQIHSSEGAPVRDKAQKRKETKSRRKLVSDESSPEAAKSGQHFCPALPGESDSVKSFGSESIKAKSPKRLEHSESANASANPIKDDKSSKATEQEKSCHSESAKAPANPTKGEKSSNAKPTMANCSDSMKASAKSTKGKKSSKAKVQKAHCSSESAKAPANPTKGQSSNAKVPNVKSGNSDSAKAPKKADPKKGDQTSAKTTSGKNQNSESAKAPAQRTKGGDSSQRRIIKPIATSGNNGSRKSNEAPLSTFVRGKRKQTSPAVSHQPAKKQAGTFRSFSEAVKADKTVLIRRVNSGFNNELINNLRAQLCQRLDASLPGAARPIFESNGYWNGSFRVVCANESSREWLFKQIQEIDSLEGSKLWISTAEREASRQKVTMTIQDSKSISSELIFRRFREANEGLKTDEWVLLKNLKDGPTGRTILLSVDVDSAEYMIAHGKRLYYMLQRVYFDIRARSSKTSSNQDSMA